MALVPLVLAGGPAAAAPGAAGTISTIAGGVGGRLVTG
jgi:hypothetical protein